MKNSFILLVLSSFFLLGMNQLIAQKKSGFTKANPGMIKALNKYRKSHPKQVQSYTFTNNKDAVVIDIRTLKKAYDLNPNDLSLKAGKHLDSTFLLVVPLGNTTNPKNRLKNDRMSFPKVRKVMAITGIFPSRSILAAFILKPDGLGNFEIQD